MMNNLIKHLTMSNIGLILLIIAAIGDLLIPFILAPFYKNYSHLTMVMSSLGNHSFPLSLIYNLWLIIAGIMFFLGGLRLYTIYSSISHWLSAGLFIIILFYAIGACILAGIFPVGETKELATAAQKIHGYGAALGFLFLTFAPLIIGILSIHSKSSLLGAISLLCYLLALVSFILFIMADKKDFAETIISNEGLWQRLSLLCMYTPIVLIACKNIINN